MLRGVRGCERRRGLADGSRRRWAWGRAAGEKPQGGRPGTARADPPSGRTEGRRGLGAPGAWQCPAGPGEPPRARRPSGSPPGAARAAGARAPRATSSRPRGSRSTRRFLEAVRLAQAPDLLADQPLGDPGHDLEQRVGADLVEVERAVGHDARTRSLTASQEEEDRELAKTGRALEGAYDVDPADACARQLRIDEKDADVVVPNGAQDLEARGDGDDVPARPAQGRLEPHAA